MTTKKCPTYYERCEKLLQTCYNAHLSDFNILNDKQLTTQWPMDQYTPAEVAYHYAKKHNLQPLG